MADRSALWMVALALVLLGGAFALGYVVGQGSGEETTSTEGVLLNRAEQPVEPGVRGGGADAPELEGRPDETLSSLRRAVAAIPSPEVERGDGVITGVVLTEAGKPLADVAITGVPESKRSKGTAPDDLAASVREYVDRWRRMKATRREAATDAEGRFRLEGLADQAHHVTARRDGWSIHAEACDWRIQPGTELRYKAHRIHRVLVHVFMPNGSEPETATIHFKSGDVSQGIGWRSETKWVQIQPGTYRVSATAGKHEGYGSEGVDVVIPEDGEAPPVTLRVEARPAIIAHVRYADGQRLPGVEVRLRKLGPSQKADPAVLANGATSQSTHDDDPTLTFRDLAPGRYLLGVTRGWGGKIVAVTEVSLGSGPLEMELPVPPLRREEYAVVRVLGPDGKTLSGAQIYTNFRSDSMSGSGGGLVIDREDGSKLVLHNPYGDPKAPNARYGIVVTHPSYGTRTVEYEPGGQPDFRIEFADPVTLKLEVEGLVGTPYDGRINAALHHHTEEGYFGNPVASPRPLDERGATVLKGIQPGEYDVMLSLAAQHFGGHVTREPVRVEPGGSAVRITLPALYELTIENIASTGHLSQEKGYLHRNVQPTDDGRAVIDGLPAGTYTIHAGGKSAEVTLPGTSTVRLE